MNVQDKLERMLYGFISFTSSKLRTNLKFASLMHRNLSQKSVKPLSGNSIQVVKLDTDKSQGFSSGICFEKVLRCSSTTSLFKKALNDYFCPGSVAFLQQQERVP